MNEKTRIDKSSSWYLEEQLDIDKRLIAFRYKTIQPYLHGPEGLELGSADGQMTRFLVNDFKRLTVVDGAYPLLKAIPDYSNIIKVHSLFEDYEPKNKFNTIILEHILEHVEQPINLLRRACSWLAPHGHILIGVPNGNSFHRLAAVKMGLLKHQYELNQRDIIQGHRRVYTQDTLKNDIVASGLRIIELGGVFFKPLSNKQIQDNWNDEMIQGFYELGKDFQYYAADIFAVCAV